MLVIGIEIDKVRVSKYRVRYIINIYIINIYIYIYICVCVYIIYIYIYIYIYIFISTYQVLFPYFLVLGLNIGREGGVLCIFRGRGLETDPEVQRPKFGRNAKLINRQIFLHDASVSFFAVEKPSFDF